MEWNEGLEVRILVDQALVHCIKLPLEIIYLLLLAVQLLSFLKDFSMFFLNLFELIDSLVVYHFQFILVILIYLILE